MDAPRPLPFRLLLVTDFAAGEDALLAALSRALEAKGPVAVQHRQPGVSTRAYLEMGRRLKALCDRAGAPLFSSARLDVALALGTHLHLPAWALRPADVRAALPAGSLLSTSVHDAPEVDAALGADLALLSPVWPAGSKPGDARPTLGPEGFRALAARLRCPAFALGGVTAERLATLRPLAGAAAVSSVLRAPDPALAVRALLAALD